VICIDGTAGGGCPPPTVMSDPAGSCPGERLRRIRPGLPEAWRESRL